MKNQYEQACNAAALAKMGVPVVKGLKDKHLDGLDQWLQFSNPIPVHYPDETAAVLDKLLREHLK